MPECATLILPCAKKRREGYALTRSSKALEYVSYTLNSAMNVLLFAIDALKYTLDALKGYSSVLAILSLHKK